MDRADDWIARRRFWILGVALAIGFILRFTYSTFSAFNGDEAIHFYTSHRASIFEVYTASHDTAHPPLFFILLHFWLYFGTGEIFARFLPVICGLAAIALGYIWSRRFLNEAGSLAVLLLLTFSGPLIALSAVVRGYSFLTLVCFACLYCLERSFEARSEKWLLLSGACLCVAALSHYSSFLFAFAIAIYGLLRIFTSPLALRFRLLWFGINTAVVLIFVFLFFTHIRFWHGSVMENEAANGWLVNQYFDSKTESVRHFLGITRRAALSYLMGNIGILAQWIFLIGAALMIFGFGLDQKQKSAARWMGIIAPLAFILAAGVAVARLYPFGGSRHSIYLLPFAMLPFGATMSLITFRRPLIVLMTAVVLVAIYCYIGLEFSRHQLQHTVTRAQMQADLERIQSLVPRGSCVLADGNTQMLLSYYWGKNSMEKGGKRIGNYSEFHYNGYTIFSGMEWIAKTPDIQPMARDVKSLGARDPLWVIDLCREARLSAGREWPVSSNALVLQLSY